MVFVLSVLGSTTAIGATIAPPMLDITRQCDANSRHNVTAMSECVVAESEARSEVLQKWGRLPDASVERCIKLSRKAKRLPYTAIAKCLAVEPADGPPLMPIKPADSTTEAESSHKFLPTWLSNPLHH